MSEPLPADTHGGDDLLAELAEQFLRRHRAGERPSVDEYAEKHPELAERIRNLFPAVVAMEEPGFGATLESAPPTEHTGATIGRYKLRERIGEGGFGVVYMAEQQHPVRRKVALKVIKPGIDTRQVIARFEAERQALALMDHENIAKVLDAGATDSGRPYFVMELVHGVPITEYCDKNQLPTRERLELFVQVCRAVQHAHTKGIIHRDIKPTNVMVTLHEGVAVPKVIDFGIAKATGQQLTEKTLFTNFAQMVGTPLYMSPEQAEMTGIDVDTRSDVYSLGVLLYELLTGTTPVDKDRLKQAAFDEVRRIIREEEPPRPSTRMSTMGEQARRSISAQRKSDPRRLGQLFRGELDWIVMKAMDKERVRRYETPNGLARDIERYLRDETVEACPPSAAYRLRKFARRHKTALLATAATVFGLLTLVVGLAVSNRMIAGERDQKQDAFEGEQQARAAEMEQRIRAQELERATRAHLYASQINLAQQAWESGEIVRLNELLNLQVPKPGEEDQRGFEWYHLWRLAHSERMAFFAGDAPVRAMAISPDGRRIASANGRSVKLWDRANAQLELELPLGAEVRCVQFSPDGRFLAAGGGAAQKPGVASIWDLAEPHSVRKLNEISGTVLCLAFSPDGNVLATGTAKILAGGGTVWSRLLRVASSRARGEIRLWERDSGKPLGALDGETNGILCLAFSPDGGGLVAGSWDKTVSAWDVKTRAKAVASKPLQGFVWSTTFSPDGKLLALGTGDWDGSPGTMLLDPRTLEQRATFYGHRVGTAAVAFSPDGKTLATGSFDHTAKLWDVATGREKQTIRGHSGFVVAVGFTPDGRSLATASWDKSVKLWDVTAPQGASFYHGSEVAPYSLAFGPDSRTLAASTDGSCQLLDTVAEMTWQEMSAPGADQMVAVSVDGKMVATAGVGGTARVWDAQLGRLLHSLSATGEKIWDLAFSPDGKTLATGGTDQTARLWDLATGRVIHSFDKQGATVRSVTFSPDGAMLAVASSGGPAVNVYDPKSGRLLEAIPGLGVCVQFTPDMKTMVGATGSGLRFWDRERRVLRALRTGHTEPTYDMALSPDGRTAATASWDGTVKVWHVASGDLMLTLNPEGGAVWTVAFSPDGRMLAAGAGTTANDKRAVRIWHAASDSDVSIDPSTMERMNVQAWTLRQSGLLKEAAALRQQVVEAARASMTRGDPRRIRYQLDCAVLLTQMKQYEQAERLLLDSKSALDEPNTDPMLALRAASGLAELYNNLGQPEKVAQYHAKLPALRAATQPASNQALATNNAVGQVVSSADPEERRSRAVAELAERKLALVGADCDAFFIRAAAHARREEVDAARMWLGAGDQRLERYCQNVERAKGLRDQAVRVLHEAGVTLPPSPNSADDRLRRYQQVIEANPDSAWAYQLRGQIYAETSDRDKAEADYRQAFELLARRNAISLDDAQQVHDFAAASLNRRQWCLAIAGLGRLIDLRGDNERPKGDRFWTEARPHQERAYAYGWVSDYEKSAAEYTKALELAPGVAELWARRGAIHSANGQLDKALADYSKAAKLTPIRPAAWPWDGYVDLLVRLEKWREASDELGKSVQANPGNVSVAYQRALVLLGAGEISAYREACRAIVTQLATSGGVTGDLAAWACALGPQALDDLSPALRAAEQASSADPRNLQSLTTLGAVLCRAGRCREAIDRLIEVDRQAAEPSETSATSPAYAWFFLAMAEHRLGNHGEAAKWYAKASQYTEKLLASPAAPDSADGKWNRRLTLRLLRDEATALLHPPAAAKH